MAAGKNGKAAIVGANGSLRDKTVGSSADGRPSSPLAVSLAADGSTGGGVGFARPKPETCSG
jgi:hypothetical protein